MAVDLCGNQQSSAPVDVNVDNIPPCSADNATLCLQNDRFSARVSINGSTAAPIPFANRGGFFRLADPEAAEVAVKVLDGRSVNGRFWVFHGSLTSQPYTLTVTDTTTGKARTFTKDSGSFCGDADLATFTDLEGLFFDRATTSTCTPTTTSVCLLGDRFKAEVIAGGSPQTGYEAASKTGSFSFSGAAPDVVVKIIDGTSVNGHYWVFYGSLTDQAYQVRITDTLTGFVKSYAPPAALCGGADAGSF